MLRYISLLLMLALSLTACSLAPAEEQMYAAAIDTFFAQTKGYDQIQQRVVYIDPNFGGAPGQPVPAAILDRIVAHTDELGFTYITPLLEWLAVMVCTSGSILSAPRKASAS